MDLFKVRNGGAGKATGPQGFTLFDHIKAAFYADKPCCLGV